MGYRQLSIEERCEIARLRAEGASVREVARRLDRAASTVTRELRRNASPTGGYRPSVAHDRAWGRRWCGPRSNGTRSCAPTSSDASAGDVRPSRSPASWPGRKAGRSSPMRVSTGSSTGSPRGGRTMAGDGYLPQGKWKRGRRGRKGGSSASFISLRRPTLSVPSRPRTVRPAGTGKRTRCSLGGQGRWCWPLHERHSRLVIAARAPSKAAGPIAETIAGVLGPLPPVFRQTVTFDNGTEFARHHELHDRDLLLRHLLAVAEGRGGERDRAASPIPAP